MLGTRYRIERELGRGGMACVYLAEDLKHAREVAVKVIRPELAVSLGSARFLREIGIAARLRHPNIMPLYDSGNADGVLYFVMPYEDGPSLRTRLDAGPPLTIGEATSTLRDVARALAYAHEQGVVHRDVKPDNVMLSGGAAVVTDFGIAKAVTVAQDEATSLTITRTGVGIGTPSYMAPEQAIGDPATDHRADIYSFGCLAYELLTGTPPFTGTSGHKIIAAHMSAVPAPLSATRADIPAPLAALVLRCLAKDPADRPQSATELVAALGESSTGGGSGEVVGSATKAPGGRTLARRLRPRALVLAVVTAAVAITAYGVAHRRAAVGNAGAISVAVLPLVSRGGDSLQSLVAEGLSDDIQTALVRFPWVRVISRDGVRGYRDSVDIESIGRTLGARYLIRGTYRTIAAVSTIQVELVSSSDRSVLWAGRFDRPAELAAVRDEIVQEISDSLRTRAGPIIAARERTGVRAHRGSDESYRLYLVGQRKLDQRGLSVGESIALFRQAIALDTLSAQSYSGLSMALALAPYFQAVPTASIAAEANASAERALRLDPHLSQPHVARGLVAMEQWNWELAGREYRAAIELDAHDVEARVQYGRYLQLRGRDAEALAEFQAGRRDDPASALVSSWTAYSYMLAGQLDSAQRELDRAIQINRTNFTTSALGGLLLHAAGRDREALALTMQLPAQGWNGLYLLGALGQHDSVLARLGRMDRIVPAQWLSETAHAFSWLGLRDSARALAALERATAAHEIWPAIQPVTDPMYDDIRASAHFQALLQKVGLPTDFVSATRRLQRR